MLRTANQAVDGLAEVPADRTLLLDNVPKGSLVRGRRRRGRKGGSVCRKWLWTCHMAWLLGSVFDSL